MIPMWKKGRFKPHSTAEFPIDPAILAAIKKKIKNADARVWGETYLADATLNKTRSVCFYMSV